MANQYKNEVIYNGQTLINLKNDTVTPSKVLSGETFHDRSGAPQTGSMITHNVYDGLDSTSADDALSANMGRALKTSIDDTKKIKTKTFSMGSSSDSESFRNLGIPNGSFISALVTNQNYIIALPYTYNGMNNEYLGFFNINSMGSRVSGKFDLYIVYFE